MHWKSTMHTITIFIFSTFLVQPPLPLPNPHVYKVLKHVKGWKLDSLPASIFADRVTSLPLTEIRRTSPCWFWPEKATQILLTSLLGFKQPTAWLKEDMTAPLRGRHCLRLLAKGLRKDRILFVDDMHCAVRRQFAEKTTPQRTFCWDCHWFLLEFGI